MADPVTLATIGMGATAGGGIFKAFGAYEGGQASSEMYKYRAAVAQQNANYQLAAGDVAAERSGMKSRFQIGQTRAAQGASSLDVDRGSAPLVRQGEHDVAIQEQGIIRSDAARRAYGEQAEAALDVSAGKQAKIAGGIGAVSSILGAATSVSDKWLYGKSVGLYSDA